MKAILLTAIALAVAAQAADKSPAKFSFGLGQPAPGHTAVAADHVYTSESGFGFEPGATIKVRDGAATSDQPFAFSIKLPEGNHHLTLTFGSDVAPSITTVKAEARRLMIENIEVPAGHPTTREITINIRTPRLDHQGGVKLKQREKDGETVTWDDKLTLEFSGARPALRALEVTPTPATPTVYLAGDSTVCDQPLEPWNSWGQMLPRFFKPGVAVANYAQSGESIRSSLGARRFEKIFSNMKPGDWLLIQFGHNDMKDRAPDALQVYRANLKKLVAQTRSKGGVPVLITSMERKGGVTGPTLAGYPDAVRAVAREDQVALIDLNALSVTLYQSLGDDLGKAFQDGTHHTNYGSYELAKCVAAGIANAKLDLAAFLVAEVKSFDPAHPDPLATFKVPSSAATSAAKPDGN